MEMGVEADENSEISGGEGDKELVGEVVNGGKESAKFISGGGEKWDENAFGVVEVKTRE